jgi:hypothetical protein
VIEKTFVEWGNPIAGSGFVPFDDPKREPAGKPFRITAEDLLSGPLGQPPPGTAGNDRHPAWSLHQVNVNGVGPHWCFAVQGREGAFGLAGSCQFVFVPIKADPVDVWRECTRLVGPDGRLRYQPHDRTPAAPPEPPSLVEKAMTALARGRRRVAVDADPAAVAATIECLLRVVPIEVVQAYLWTTWLLKHPVVGDLPLVAGRWPDEFRDTPAAIPVARWLARPVAEPNRKLPFRGAEAIAWLTEAALSGRPEAQHYRARSHDMIGLLDAVARDDPGLRLDDVPGLVETGSPKLSHGEGRKLTVLWAEKQPEKAIASLVTHRVDGELAAVLMDGLLDAHVRAGSGKNPVFFPPAAEPHPGWHSYLAEALRTRFGHPDLLEFVRNYLVAAGRPLADRGVRAQWRHWLTLLGVSQMLGIFPVPTESIIEDLTRSGQISSQSKQLLRSATDIEGELNRVIDLKEKITPDEGAELLLCAADVGQSDATVWELAKHMLEHNGHDASERDGWLGQVITDQRLTGEGKSALLAFAVDYFGPGLLPAAFLSEAVQVLANRAAEPAEKGIMQHCAAHLAVSARGTGQKSAGTVGRHRAPDQADPWEPDQPDLAPRPPPFAGTSASEDRANRQPAGQPGDDGFRAAGSVDGEFAMAGVGITVLLIVVLFAVVLLLVVNVVLDRT